MKIFKSLKTTLAFSRTKWGNSKVTT